jgi:hypothetical protein
MTFAELFTHLDTQGALPRAKDMKTSLRKLATALGYARLEQCPVRHACQDADTWVAVLETHWGELEAKGQTISAATRRNTKNNLRGFFRQAQALSLLGAPLPTRLLRKPNRLAFELAQQASAPYRETYHPQSGPRRFGLLQAQWPPSVVQGWRAYRARVGLRIRESTLRANASRLTSYLGYLTTIRGKTPTWDDCFDIEQLTEYVRWHGARMGHPGSISIQGQLVVRQVAAMAAVLAHPASEALATFRRTLPEADAMHKKRVHHWVPLATLEAVAEAWLAEGRLPVVRQRHLRHPGVQRAVRFQRGVILKLLVRVPLRQRNIREMRLGHNLYQDHGGHWQVHFAGDELKIGRRGCRGGSLINQYHIDLTEYFPDLLPVLGEFLQVHRPRLPNAATSPFCFLTYQGGPYTIHSLGKELSTGVAMRTGQRFYPHLIRSIWATEYLEVHPGDYRTAALMLGDTIATVQQTYEKALDSTLHARASTFLGTALGRG